MRNPLIIRFIIFILAGCSLTNFYIYYFGNWFVNVSEWWPIQVLVIGIPLGILISTLPWGKHLWKGYVISFWLLAVHIYFIIRNQSFDLKDMNYTSVLNFQFFYYLPAIIMAFFFFQPWKWGEPKREATKSEITQKIDSNSNSVEL